MGVTAILQDTPDYHVSYKTRNDWLLLLYGIWLLSCTLNVVKGYKNYGRGGDFNSLDILWTGSLFIYLLLITDVLLATATFTIQNRKLILVRRGVFKQKAIVYEIDRMFDLEVKPIMEKRYFPTRVTPSGKYKINFLYDEYERKLDPLPSQACAEQLLSAIAEAKASS